VSSGKEVRRDGVAPPRPRVVSGWQSGLVGGGEGRRRRGYLHSHRWVAEKAGRRVEGDGVAH
jgi:hypothetical protein